MLDPRKPPPTLAVLAQRAFVEHAARPALGTKPKGETEYRFTTYADLASRVRAVAGGLLSLGIGRGDRVAILCENRPEWAVADLACQMLGAISVSLFSTLPPNQVEYILNDSGSAAVFLSTPAQLKKIVEIRDSVPQLRHAILMDWPENAPSEQASPAAGPSVLALNRLEEFGNEHYLRDPSSYEMAWPAALGDDVATLIYTSGTTGEPKGVMLTHTNLISNIEALLPLLDWSIDDTFLSFLPLAHVYERMAGYYLPLRLGACIAYCESLFTVDKNMREVRPTIMLCVPRLLESMAEKIRDVGGTLPDGQGEKYADAMELAQKSGAAEGCLPGAPGLGLGEKLKYKVYDAKVYSKIREKTGGRLRAFVSGGAPISADLVAFFTGLGLNVWEGYGLTETSPVIAVNRPGRVHVGTVGEVVESVKVSIAEDGEILVRGASVFKGYWDKPADTAQAIDPEGWFHTGDVGTLENGYLKITDRKKDILVLANGKNVAPVPIEMELAKSKYILQVVLVGDKLKAVNALIVPNLELIQQFAGEGGLAIEDTPQLLASQPIRKLIRGEIDRLTTGLADYEKVRQFALLAEPFSMEKGEVTPTLKLKRRVIAERYGELVG